MRSGRWLLAASALGALNTVNAYRPIAKRGRGGIVAFAAGGPTTETPLLSAAGQAVMTALAASRGALTTGTGRLALAIDLASWAGLVALAIRGRRGRCGRDGGLGCQT